MHKQCISKAGGRSKYAKSDLRYWKETVYKPSYSRGGEASESPNWAIQIKHQGRRTTLSLGTANKEAAAAKARDIYHSLQANGWEATLAKFRPDATPALRADTTVGDFIGEVKAKADGNPKTIEGYCRSLRKIVADIAGLANTREKFDFHTGGYQRWLEKVHGVRLAAITPGKVQAWKRSFLSSAGKDPLSQRRAKVSVNSFLRQARSLFSPKLIRHLNVALPNPLPFAGVEFEPRQSLKYHSGFDALALIGTARDVLSEEEPELFKIFLLAVMVGLRRKEIDLLEWSSFLWEPGIIRIQPTLHFQPKSEDSIGDVPIDPELMEIFRGYRARATGDFVIESANAPKPGATYSHYRCQADFEKLTDWLRMQGINANKPLHTLRKEYGSVICAMHGIHAASRALRHADIGITNQFYTDARARVTPGMGHLLTPAKENITPITGDSSDEILSPSSPSLRARSKNKS
jgi:integrase